jgi:hypothetical protein
MLNNKKIRAVFLLIVTIFLFKVIKSFEIRMVISVLLLVYEVLVNKGRVSKKIIDLLGVLTLIVLLGSFVSVFHKPILYDFIKDFLYFIKPIVLILLGYFMAKRINKWQTVLKAVIYVSVFMGAFHIVHTLLYTNFNNVNVAYIRSINGLGNIIEVFSIGILITSFKYKEILLFSTKVRNIMLFVLLISFVLYFSRTLFVALFLFSLASLGFTKINKKGLKYLTIGSVAIFLFYSYLFSINIPRDSTGFDSFLYKMKIAPEEIFSPQLDLNNKATLWDHWRAYEAYSAIQCLEDKPVNYMFGKGFGALIDLKFLSPLGEEGMRYIPIIHNGYVFILYKTGVVGLFLYLLFLIYLYAQSYKKQVSITNGIIRNILAGFGLYLLFSSLIITGIYNVEELTPFILGVFFYLKTKT